MRWGSLRANGASETQTRREGTVRRTARARCEPNRGLDAHEIVVITRIDNRPGRLRAQRRRTKPNCSGDRAARARARGVAKWNVRARTLPSARTEPRRELASEVRPLGKVGFPKDDSSCRTELADDMRIAGYNGPQQRKRTCDTEDVTLHDVLDRDAPTCGRIHTFPVH